jgi:hypothetical protein
MSDLPMRIDRLLRAFDPHVARRGLAFLSAIGEARLAAGDGRSLLAGGGSPVEVTFVSAAGELRITAEPALPDAPISEKWDAATSIFGSDPATDPLIDALRRARDQRVGCWVGSRHRANGSTLKLYQEVPATMQSAARSRIRREYGDAGDLVPQLVGIRAGAEALEHYCVVPRPSPARLHALCSLAGQAHHAQAILRSIGFLGGSRPRGSLRELSLGISFRCRTVTLFVKCAQLFRNDREARSRILALARHLRRDLPVYELATRSLPASGRVSIHGLIALAASDDGVDCAVGVRPFQGEEP